MLKNETQKELIHRHLATKSITPLEALSLYGCFRLASVIFKLKKEGLDIICRTKIDYNISGKPKMYAEYKIRLAGIGEDRVAPLTPPLG